jgi:pteridine reductase
VVAPRGGPVVISAVRSSRPAATARPLALITGAAKRLGAVTARRLHGAGFDIAIHYHTSAGEARQLATELNADRAHSAFVVRQNLAARNAGARLVAAIAKRAGRLDVLVNNASIFDETPLDDADPATWERMQAINLRTPYFLCVHAARLLGAQHGNIVNIVDIHAERPRRGYSMYCASKAGLLAVTRSLALELAPAVRVNAIAPGAILWADSEDGAQRTEWLRATPLARRGEPADIADAVLYLVHAPYVTGQVISVDGGRSLHM